MQALTLIMSIGHTPSARTTRWLEQSVAEVSLSGQRVFTFSCAFEPGLGTRIFIDMNFPMLLAVMLMSILGVVWAGCWLYATAVQKPCRPTWRMFLPKHTPIATFQENSSGQTVLHRWMAEVDGEMAVRACSNCLRTASVTSCVEEGLLLCEPCNRVFHPRHNREKQGHHKFVLDPVVGGLQGLTIWIAICLVLYESYVLTGVQTVYSLMLWWDCTDIIDNGNGLVAAYLTWATEQVCNGGEYYAIWAVVFVAIVWYCFGIPLAHVALLFPKRKKLHMEKTLVQWGWLYQGYHWYAYHWELVLEARKMLFAFLTSFNRMGNVNQYCAVLLVCLVNIIVNYTVQPFIWSLATTTDTYFLVACGVSCVVLIMYQEDRSASQITVAIVNIVAFLVNVAYNYYERPEIFYFAAFKAKSYLCALKRFICCESRLEIFSVYQPSSALTDTVGNDQGDGHSVLCPNTLDWDSFIPQGDGALEFCPAPTPSTPQQQEMLRKNTVQT